MTMIDMVKLLFMPFLSLLFPVIFLTGNIQNIIGLVPTNLLI